MDDHTCQECFEPFQLKNGQCDISDCQTLNDYGCVTCECGFYLTKDRTCAEIDQGCIRYERGHCVNCLSHYKLKGGACQIDGCEEYSGQACTKCHPDYHLNIDGGCKFNNCVDWINGECLVCESGFKMVEGKCQQ